MVLPLWSLCHLHGSLISQSFTELLLYPKAGMSGPGPSVALRFSRKKYVTFTYNRGRDVLRWICVKCNENNEDWEPNSQRGERGQKKAYRRWHFNRLVRKKKTLRVEVWKWWEKQTDGQLCKGIKWCDGLRKLHVECARNMDWKQKSGRKGRRQARLWSSLEAIPRN